MRTVSIRWTHSSAERKLRNTRTCGADVACPAVSGCTTTSHWYHRVVLFNIASAGQVQHNDDAHRPLYAVAGFVGDIGGSGGMTLVYAHLEPKQLVQHTACVVRAVCCLLPLACRICTPRSGICLHNHGTCANKLPNHWACQHLVTWSDCRGHAWSAHPVSDALCVCSLHPQGSMIYCQTCCTGELELSAMLRIPAAVPSVHDSTDETSGIRLRVGSALGQKRKFCTMAIARYYCGPRAEGTPPRRRSHALMHR